MDGEDPLKTGMNKGGQEPWFQRFFGHFLCAQKVTRRRNRIPKKSSFNLFLVKITSKEVFTLPTQLPAFSPNLIPYNRENAVNYALQWALNPNPRFYNYSKLGGDCTNFASQVILAGGAVMNLNPVHGWYYIDPNHKSPSWTGVNFLYDFLVTNREQGPWAEVVSVKQIQIGDIIQLSFHSGIFQHSLVVTQFQEPYDLERVYISTHTPNAKNVRLTGAYSWEKIRFIHILGSRA